MLLCRVGLLPPTSPTSTTVFYDNDTATASFPNSWRFHSSDFVTLLLTLRNATFRNDLFWAGIQDQEVAEGFALCVACLIRYPTYQSLQTTLPQTLDRDPCLRMCESMLPTMPHSAEHNQLGLIRGWTSPQDRRTIDADPCDVMLVALKRLQLSVYYRKYSRPLSETSDFATLLWSFFSLR